MDPLQFRRPAALVYLSMREKGREIVRHGLAAVPPSQHCGTRLWARTTSDYSKAFTRIRDAVAALPVESAVLDGEAIVMRSADRCDFEALRSRQGQAEAILVTYDVTQVEGADLRSEPLEKRRKHLTRLLARSNKAMREGLQLSEAITGDGAEKAALAGAA